MRWLALIALVLVGCGEAAAPKREAAVTVDPTATAAATPTPTPTPTATPCAPVRGEPEPGSRARMGPGMEVGRTPTTLAAGRGVPMLVTGAVRRPDCSPVAGVRVTAWQANARGAYGPNRRHECCYLTATVRTDREGRYALDTIVPASYSGGEPHIHIEVQGRGLDEIMVEGRPRHLRHDIVLPQR